MKSLNIMIKPASSLCNMRCKYCFYADVANRRSNRSYGMMTEESMNDVLENIASDLKAGDRVCFAFQGGEPTLAGLDFFERFASRVSEWSGIDVSYALQTNGILIDDKWCEFLKKHKFLVGLSLDILPEAHDFARVDEKGAGTYASVVRAMELLKKHKVDFNVLATLTNSLARHPEKVYKQIKKLGISYVQFTPCLGELDGRESSYALIPKRFADFYIQLFKYWYADYRMGKYISIKFFDDVVNLMILGRPTSCGMNGCCSPQLVVEADGSAYPCDFYCLDEYKLGNLTENSVTKLFSGDSVKRFLKRENEKPLLCKMCKYREFCGGNCERMRSGICCKTDDIYCGYQDFLDKCGPVLLMLAKRVGKER